LLIPKDIKTLRHEGIADGPRAISICTTIGEENLGRAALSLPEVLSSGVGRSVGASRQRSVLV
jgi:hypothetical protein